MVCVLPSNIGPGPAWHPTSARQRALVWVQVSAWRGPSAWVLASLVQGRLAWVPASIPWEGHLLLFAQG